MAVRPLLFLDIDGVLNPALPAAGFTAHEVLGFTVLLSAEHADWLRELSGPYDLVWATTWEHEANRHIAPLLGLPELPVVEFSRFEARSGDPLLEGIELFEGRKWPPIVRFAAGRPFAWIDDVMPDRIVRESGWRRDRLLLPVDPGLGLTRPAVDRLLRKPPAPRRLSGARALLARAPRPGSRGRESANGSSERRSGRRR